MSIFEKYGAFKRTNCSVFCATLIFSLIMVRLNEVQSGQAVALLMEGSSKFLIIYGEVKFLLDVLGRENVLPTDRGLEVHE